MSNIDNLRRQHEEIYKVVEELKKLISKPDLENAAIDIAQKINLLTGKLIIHLGTEDEFLYPKLLKSENKEVKNLAKAYVEEMGNINSKFNEYKSKYNTKSKILENINEIISDTKKILQILEGRMKKEDFNLYTMLQ